MDLFVLSFVYIYSLTYSLTYQHNKKYVVINLSIHKYVIEKIRKYLINVMVLYSFSPNPN